MSFRVFFFFPKFLLPSSSLNVPWLPFPRSISSNLLPFLSRLTIPQILSIFSQLDLFDAAGREIWGRGEGQGWGWPGDGRGEII